MLKTGDKAPSFRLASTSGGDVSLASLRGKRVVLYFYPKDDTPGCTREACDFRDRLATLRAAGVEVLGVSKDGLASHSRFREKYRLPFELLADEGNEVARAYGAFGEKNMYGRKILGTIRSTFLIGPTGRIEAVWSPVKVAGHVDEVLERLRGAPEPAKAVRKTPKKTSAGKASAKKRATKAK
jgi:peroxiredoxin Q/BCP